MRDRLQVAGCRLQMEKKIGKRGQLFSLWMVIMTLFLCGVSIGLYNVQQDKLAVSLVSPLSVLEVRDNLTIFEIQEKELILESLKSVSSEFGPDDFVSEFRENFISGLSGDMKDFLLQDLVVNQEGADSWDNALKESFFRNVVYGNVKMNGDRLLLIRGKVEKNRVLSSGDWSVVNFPVEFEFEFEREYIISKVGGDYIVEVGK